MLPIYTKTRVIASDSCPPPRTRILHASVDTATSGADAGRPRKVGSGDSTPDDFSPESREKCQSYEMRGVEGDGNQVSFSEIDKLVVRESSCELGSRSVNLPSPAVQSTGESGAMITSATYSSERNRAGGNGDLLEGEPGNTQRLVHERQTVAGEIRRKQKENIEARATKKKEDAAMDEKIAEAHQAVLAKRAADEETEREDDERIARQLARLEASVAQSEGAESDVKSPGML